MMFFIINKGYLAVLSNIIYYCIKIYILLIFILIKHSLFFSLKNKPKFLSIKKIWEEAFMKLILKVFLCIVIVFSLLIPSCSKNSEPPKKETVKSEPKMDAGNENKSTNSYKGKKVLYIDSYHEGYAWSDGITNGIKSIFDGKEIELSIFRMDTKRNGDEAFKKSTAEKAKAEVESLKPDAVIVSDDNATNLVLAQKFILQFPVGKLNILIM